MTERLVCTRNLSGGVVVRTYSDDYGRVHLVSLKSHPNVSVKLRRMGQYRERLYRIVQYTAGLEALGAYRTKRAAFRAVARSLRAWEAAALLGAL